MKFLELSEIHQVTIGVVKKIIDICKNQNIKYFVMYGSLIGAVRHKGFIPWDDDFDIIMLRPEYERFINYCYTHKEELKPYQLINRYTNENYPFNISRFCDCRYEMIRDDGEENAGMGIFVDIYPFDGLGNNPMSMMDKFILKKFFLITCLNYATIQKINTKNDGVLKSACKRLIWGICHAIGKKRWLRLLVKFRNTYDINESKYVGCVVWDQGLFIFEKDWFNNPIMMEFEGMKVAVPDKYHEILSIVYGNYMELPTPDKRIPSHEYKIIKI